MKITFMIGDDTREHRGRRFDGRTPYVDADHVLVDEPCPNCKHEAPLKLRGRNQHHSHKTFHATAVALCCNVAVGKLEVEVNTMFGIEEDRAVLSGRWRVY